MESEPAEIVCSSPQGSVIELLTDSTINMDETQNRSHITIGSNGLTSNELDELNEIESFERVSHKEEDGPFSIMSSPEVPSAQLTSFRMRSPVKRLSPLRKKLNLLVTQESFSVPNLLQSSPSSNLYCTARDDDRFEESQYEQVVSKVPIKGSNIEIVNKNVDKFKARIIPLKRKIDSIDDDDEEEEGEEKEIPQSSEDEGETSLIEITRKVKKSSVVQVISSQSFHSSPITSPNHNNFAFLDQIESDQEDEPFNRFNGMSMNQLRQKIIEYGLKPSKSKLKMIESLNNVYKKIQPETILKLTQYESQSQSGFNHIKNSQNLIKFDILNTLNKKFLKVNDEKNPFELKLFEKIYTFQPIHKADLKKFFKNELDDSENDELILKKWCNWNSICLIENQDP